MTLLAADRLTRRFGQHTALDDFSVTVEEGEIVGLIGPSGGGKTTAVRLMCGIDRPDHGSVQAFGKPVGQLGMKERQRMALLAQDPAIVPEFTIAEQIKLAAKLRGIRPDLSQALKVVGLGDHGNTRLSDASGGMRRRAGLAATLISDPDLVFLDEPTAGLDPIIRDDLWGWFRSRRDEGRAMLVTTQHIDEAARCNRVIVLREGSIIADAKPSDLRAEAGLAERLVVHVPAADIDRSRLILYENGMAVTKRRHELIVDTEDAAGDAGSVAELLISHGVDVKSLDTDAPGLDEIFRTLVER